MKFKLINASILPGTADGLADYLDEMASKGFVFSHVNAGIWLRSSAPAKLRHAVKFFDYDSSISKASSSPIDDQIALYESFGWRLLWTDGDYAIFVTERGDALPIDTDDGLLLERTVAFIKRYSLRLVSVCLLTVSLLIMQISYAKKGIVSVASLSFFVFPSMFFLLFGLYSFCSAKQYLRASRKALDSALPIPRYNSKWFKKHMRNIGIIETLYIIIPLIIAVLLYFLLPNGYSYAVNSIITSLVFSLGLRVMRGIGKNTQRTFMKKPRKIQERPHKDFSLLLIILSVIKLVLSLMTLFMT